MLTAKGGTQSLVSVERTHRMKAVEEALAARAARRRLFPNHLFADPAWDILLALYSGALLGKDAGLDSFSGSGLAAKALLAWIDALQREGLIAPRSSAPPTFRLSFSGLSRMEAYFSSRIEAPNA